MMLYKGFFLSVLIMIITFNSSCNNNDSKKNTNDNVVKSDSIPVKDTIKTQIKESDYTLLPMKGNDSLYKRLNSLTKEEKVVIAHINRIDFSRIRNLDSVIIPTNLSSNLMDYSPFPLMVQGIADVDKIFYFSYPKQAYAVYENGKLLKWGATSMGKKATKTPTGLFFTNWKGRKITSTVNSSWILEYNFNVSNQGGVGWHKYDMPGYPASHSCLRLFMDDAKWLYEFADQWILSKGELIAKGNPVIIYGEYPWGQRKPWRYIAEQSDYLKISEEDLMKETSPFLDKIIEEQENRKKIKSTQTETITTDSNVKSAPVQP